MRGKAENQRGRVAATKVGVKCGLSENGKCERISQLTVRRGTGSVAADVEMMGKSSPIKARHGF